MAEPITVGDFSSVAGIVLLFLGLLGSVFAWVYHYAVETRFESIEKEVAEHKQFCPGHPARVRES